MMPRINGPTSQQVQDLRAKEDSLSARSESLEVGEKPKVDVHKIFDHIEALATKHNRPDLLTNLKQAISFKAGSRSDYLLPGGSPPTSGTTKEQRLDARLLQLASVLEDGTDLAHVSAAITALGNVDLNTLAKDVDLLADLNGIHSTDVQLLGWPEGTLAGNCIVHPNGQNPSNEDLAMAIGLIKEGAKPQMGLVDAGLKFAQQNQIHDTAQFVACHDTAAQLRSIMGDASTEQVAGGGGIDARREAIALAKSYVEQGKPSIIQLQGTATADGHSFSLIVKPDGKVDVLEAWASEEDEANIGTLLEQCKKELSLEEVATALDNIASDDPDLRTDGYLTLSTAYDDAAMFELREDPPRGADASDYRDVDANIKLEVTARDLKPMQTIMDDVSHRLEVLVEFKADMRLTRNEADWLEEQGADLTGLDIEE